MNMLQIDYFIAVAKNLSFSRAAEELFVAQPSVSKQISALESELGFTLIDRTNKNRLTLTPAGVLYYDFFQDFKHSLKYTENMAKEVSGHRKSTFRIGIVEGWSFIEFIRLCRSHFKKNLPDIELEFEAHSFQELRSRLKSADLDMILCLGASAGLDVAEGNEVTAAVTIKSAIFMAKDNPLVLKGFELNELKNEPLYILPSDETPMFKDINKDFFFANHFNPQEIIEKPNRASINLEVMSGRGYAFGDVWSYQYYSDDYYTRLVDIDIPIFAVWSRHVSRFVVDTLLKLLRDWTEHDMKNWK